MEGKYDKNYTNGKKWTKIRASSEKMPFMRILLLNSEV